MKAIVRHEYGSPNVLKLEEVAVPIPAENEVLVKIHAVSINGSDKEGLIGKPLYVRIGGFRKPGHRRELGLENVHCAEAVIPQVDTRLSMRTDTSAIGYFREGFSFSPMYTLGIKKTVKAKGELRTWLKVEKAS